MNDDIRELVITADMDPEERLQRIAAFLELDPEALRESLINPPPPPDPAPPLDDAIWLHVPGAVCVWRQSSAADTTTAPRERRILFNRPLSDEELAAIHLGVGWELVWKTHADPLTEIPQA